MTAVFGQGGGLPGGIANGGNDIFQATDSDGDRYSGPIQSDLNEATFDVAEPGRFDLTGYYGNWGTYHYDYTTTQDTTVVTRSP